MNKSTDNYLLEAALENTEVVVDALMSSEILKDIPVVGTALKLCKAWDTFRDKAFAAKLQKFVMGIGRDESQIASAWQAKMDGSPDEAQKIGEVLFLVLEQLNDTDKATMLGKVFRAYLDGKIDTTELRRLFVAISIAFIDDLEKFISPDASFTDDKSWLQPLVPSGLAIVTGGPALIGWSRIGYLPSTLGHAFINACKS